MLRRLHLASAAVLSVFSVAHLANHLSALGGLQQHIELMERLRSIYRNPVIELLVIASALAQIVTGLILVWRGRKQRRGFLAKLQAYSGVYLALFLLQHIPAVFAGRLVQAVDTNFYFAAAVLQGGIHKYYFFPYYFVGVLALFAHIGSAVQHRLKPGGLSIAVLVIFVAAGAVCALLILLAFGGALYEVRLPEEYVIGR